MDQSLAKAVRQERRKKFGKSEMTLSDVEIEEQWQRTVVDDFGTSTKFLLKDTGKDDKERILVFGTKGNLDLFKEHPDKYSWTALST
jgi:hypothetical protein